MDDLARLGYVVDTSGLRDARDELKRLRQEAERATDSITNIGRRQNSGGTDLGASSNRATSELERTANQARRTGNEVERQMNRVSRTSSAALGATGAAANQLQGIIGGLSGILGAFGLAEVAQQTANFGSALAEVSTLVDTAVFDMEALTEEALNQSREFGTLPVANVQAFYQAISAGATTAEQATEAVTAANRLAVAGVSEVSISIDGLTSVMNAYEGEAGSFADISDVLFTAVRTGKTTVDELASSIGRVAPIAAQGGVSFRETASAVAALTQGGISTNEAITGLRGVIAAIVKPTKDASDLAGELGINFNAAGLEAAGLEGFLQELITRTGGSTEQLAQLFGGVEALVPILSLTGSEGAAFNAVMAEMEQATGATDEAFEKIEQGSAFQFQRIISSATAFVLDLTRNLDGALAPALGAVATGVESFSTRLQEAISATSENQFFQETVRGLTGLVSVLRPLTPLLDEFAIALAGIGAARLAIGLVVSGVGLLVRAITGLTPFGRVLTGIALGASAIIENWDFLTEYFRNNSLPEIASDLGRFVFEGFISGVGSLVDFFGDWISAGVDWARNLLGIQSPSTVFMEIGGFIVEGLAIGIRNAFSFVTDAFSGLADFLISAAQDPIGTAVEIGGLIISAYARGIREALGAVDRIIGTSLLEAFLNVEDAIRAAAIFSRDLVASMADAITQSATGLGRTVRDLIVDALPSLPDFAIRAREVGSDLVEAIGNGIAAGADFVTESAGRVISSVGDSLVEAMRNIGGNIIEGLQQGLLSKIDDLRASVTDIASSLPGWVRRPLGIQSPSRVLRQIGVFVMEGLEEGINSRISSVQRTVGSMADGLKDTFRDLGDGLLQSLSDSIRDGDSLRDALENVGDFARNWLGDLVADFAEQNIGSLLSQGLSSVGSFFGFGGGAASTGGVAQLAGVAGGSAASGGGALAAAGANPYIAAAVAGAGILTEAADNFRDLSDSGRRAAVAISSIAPGIGIALTALGGERLFGGQFQQTNSGFTAGFEGGEVSGQSFDVFSRERSLFRGTVSRTDFRELDTEVEGAITDFFSNLNATIVDQAQTLGVSGAESILSSFSVATRTFSGDTAQADLEEFLQDTTRQAYASAFNNLAPELQTIISDSLDIFEAPTEDIEAIFNRLAESSVAVTDAVKTLNLNFDATGPSAVALSDSLVQLFGGVENFTTEVSGYFNTFFTTAERSQLGLAQAAADVLDFNESLGLTGDAAIDTRDEMRQYVESLDLTTEAGQSAFAAALGVSDAMGLVAESGVPLQEIIGSLPEHLQTAFLQMGTIVEEGSTSISSVTDDMVASFVDGAMALSDESMELITGFRDIAREGLQGLGDDAGTMQIELRNAGGELVSMMALTGDQLNDVLSGAGNEMVTDWANSTGALISQTDFAGQQMTLTIGQRGGEMVSEMTTTTGSMVDVVRSMGGSFTDVGNEVTNVTNVASREVSRLQRLTQAVEDRNNGGGDADGSFFMGLGRVPFDGFRAITHRDEAIVPANVMNFLRSAGIPISGGGDNGEGVAELQAIRLELNQLRAEQAASSAANQSALSQVAGMTAEQTAEMRTNNKDQRRINQRIAKAVGE